MPAPKSSDRNRPVRDSKGRFQPGNPGGPGNPNWCKAGRYKDALRKAISSEDIATVFKKLLRLTTEGDVHAGKLLLSYAVGKPRDQALGDSVALELPVIKSASDLAAASGKVLEAVAKGEVDLAEARGISEMLATASRIHELASVEERLKAVEDVVKDMRYL